MSETPNPAAVALIDAVGRYRYAAARVDRGRPSASETTVTEREALRYLRVIAGAGVQCTPKQLSEHLGITSSATTSLLDRLEASGFLTRVPNPTDRRSSYVRLVPGISDRDDPDVLALRIAALCASIPAADASVITRFLIDLAALTHDSTR